VINALKTAKERGMFVVAMTGETGGEMKNHCDVLINVPSKDTPRIQEAHILVGHIICQLVESEIFPKK
jgi:D-sedoheptulose 7-phosphate isomerase